MFSSRPCRAHWARCSASVQLPRQLGGPPRRTACRQAHADSRRRPQLRRPLRTRRRQRCRHRHQRSLPRPSPPRRTVVARLRPPPIQRPCRPPRRCRHFSHRLPACRPRRQNLLPFGRLRSPPLDPRHTRLRFLRVHSAHRNDFPLTSLGCTPVTAYLRSVAAPVRGYSPCSPRSRRIQTSGLRTARTSGVSCAALASRVNHSTACVTRSHPAELRMATPSTRSASSWAIPPRLRPRDTCI
jgi:hypothetical protein